MTNILLIRTMGRSMQIIVLWAYWLILLSFLAIFMLNINQIRLAQALSTIIGLSLPLILLAGLPLIAVGILLITKHSSQYIGKDCNSLSKKRTPAIRRDVLKCALVICRIYHLHTYTNGNHNSQTYEYPHQYHPFITHILLPPIFIYPIKRIISLLNKGVNQDRREPAYQVYLLTG